LHAVQNAVKSLPEGLNPWITLCTLASAKPGSLRLCSKLFKCNINPDGLAEHLGAHCPQRLLLFASLQEVGVQGVLMLKGKMDFAVLDAEARQMIQATAEEALRLVE
jgi:hypothetical protein